MTLQSIFVFFPPIISGIFLVHLAWPNRALSSIFLKLFLGAGIGLGVNSLFFFAYLNIFGRQSGYLVFQLFELSILFVLVFWQEHNQPMPAFRIRKPSILQSVFLVILVGFSILAFFIFLITSDRRPQGAWDSWMIYNRTARFIFRGDRFWTDAFSPELDWYFHTDYPPSIALNIASGWNAVGQQTIRIPKIVGGAFLFGSVGLLFTGVAIHKTLGQATLATAALLGVSGYMEIGANQLADVPLSFFILATGVLIYLYSIKKQKGLLTLAGLAAGLGAWTKNEGIPFALISLFTLLVTYRKRIKNTLSWYFLGLIVPMFTLLFFKIALAPPSDLFVDVTDQIQQALDLQRNRYLLGYFIGGLKSWGNWILLVAYFLFFRVPFTKENSEGLFACFVMLIIQLTAYYSIFIITPHALDWHVDALSRVLLQVTPLFFFFYFSITKPPETAFKFQ